MTFRQGVINTGFWYARYNQHIVHAVNHVSCDRHQLVSSRTYSVTDTLQKTARGLVIWYLLLRSACHSPRSATAQISAKASSGETSKYPVDPRRRSTSLLELSNIVVVDIYGARTVLWMKWWCWKSRLGSAAGSCIWKNYLAVELKFELATMWRRRKEENDSMRVVKEWPLLLLTLRVQLRQRDSAVSKFSTTSFVSAYSNRS